MKRKTKRLLILLACGAGLASAAGLTLSAFSDNLVFFVSPSDLRSNAAGGHQMRLGGIVEQGSVERVLGGNAGAQFKVTDGKNDVLVTYSGLLPDLFREGQGVVVLGIQQPNGVFKASEVLAKHDENYMPKEVVEALKKSGEWNPSSGSPPPNAVWNAPAKSPGS